MEGVIFMGQNDLLTCRYITKPIGACSLCCAKVRGMRGTLKINAGLGRIRKKIVEDWQHNFTQLNRPKVYGAAVQLNRKRFNKINVQPGKLAT